LHGFEPCGVAFDGALDAVGVEGEALEAGGGVGPGGGLVFGVIIAAPRLCEFGEESVFHGAGAGETPAISGDVFGDGGLDDAGWSERFDDGLAVALVGFVFAREGGMRTSGEPMAYGILGDDVFAGFGRGACRMLGVGAVGSFLPCPVKFTLRKTLPAVARRKTA
jgi:hypothetical protein